MWILTSDEMRAADRATIEGVGVPGVCLMELAGAGAARVLREEARLAPGDEVAVLCGAGNNGGDGYVLARHMANHGALPTIYLLAPRDKIAGDARVNLEAAERLELPIVPVHEPALLQAAAPAIGRARARVDAILGTGLSREVRGQAAAGIALLNRAARAFTLAIDIPSGLSADTGQPLGEAVRADATVTFGALKRGHLLHPGPAHCGPVTLVDIGIPPAVIERLTPGMWRYEEADLRRVLRPRPADSHKGDYGRLLVLAGSPGMAGAGLLAAHAGVRAGAGVVTLCSVEEGCAAARARFPSMLTRLRKPGAARPDPVAESAGFAAVVIGPGLGRDAEAEELVLAWNAACPLPMIVDADALVILARHGVAAQLARAAGRRVLTPHEGELARMTGKARDAIHRDRVAAASEAAQAWGAVVVLKGNGTLVAGPDRRVTLVDRGHPAMATGGSGDVLGGTMAALCGQGLPLRAAAEAGVLLHAVAGELAAAAIGPAGLTAEDIADFLPRARARLLQQP